MGGGHRDSGRSAVIACGLTDGAVRSKLEPGVEGESNPAETSVSARYAPEAGRSDEKWEPACSPSDAVRAIALRLGRVDRVSRANGGSGGSQEARGDEAKSPAPSSTRLALRP